MFSRASVWRVGLMLGVATHGCGGAGGAPPTGELFADPEVCDVPCEVVLDSGLDGADAQGLTFTWDFGDGPVIDNTRVFHTFETAGSHTVSVAISNGNASTTDTVVVRAAPQAKATGVIDEAGGSVSQSACTVTIPKDAAPGELTVQITQLPSMQPAAERFLGTGRFIALGNAYDVIMPWKSSVALDLAVQDAQLEGADPAELAWLIRTVSRPLPPADDPETKVSPAPLASYVLAPVPRVDPDGTAHGDIYGRRRVQLVKMAAPLEAESLPIAREASPKQIPTPLIVTTFSNAPTLLSSQAYKDAIREGLTQAHEVLVNQKGFRGPQSAVLVSVTRLPVTHDGEEPWGNVSIFDHDLIQLSNGLPSADRIKKVVAHEFFHLIQNINRNVVSSTFYFPQDGWFAEGTAAWAMDEVFDDIQDVYFATRVQRFRVPLLQPANDASPRDTYETVAFWKWADANNPNIVAKILEDEFRASHTTVPGLQAPLENLAHVDHLETLKRLWTDVDFLKFTYDARYLKNFDTGETKEHEIWYTGGDPYLGPPKQVTYRLGETLFDGAGDSESNPVRMELEVRPHLTADVMHIESYDLTGTLHVRFPVLSAPLDARVILIDRTSAELQSSQTVEDLSQKHGDVEMRFSPDEEAVIFVVDPRWSYSSDTEPIKGEILAWVEDPCGSLPTNVIDIGPSDDLYVALTTAPAGSAVRLAPGTYTPPVKDWPAPEYGPISANVVVKDLTLVGAGEGQTVLVMNGNPYVGFGFKTYGNATVRNLTIDPRDSEPAFDCWDAKNVTLCNVTIQASATTDYGLIWGPWHGGSTYLSFFDSTLTSPAPQNDPFGMFIQSCYDPPADVVVEIRKSEISGWGEGVSFDNGTCGSVSVSTDCEGFDNLYYNVVDWNCSEGTCNPIELCP
jgi:PKD repeat protein